MLIHIGSKNPVKIEGARHAFSQFDYWKTALLEGFNVDSGISEQPLSQEETIKGACRRAEALWNDKLTLSVGLEDGLIVVPQSKSGMMNICVCSLYNGSEHCLGFSSAFALPQKVMDKVGQNGLDLSQAFYEAGYTTQKNIGKSQGAIGVLTGGVLTRAGYVSQAVVASIASI